MSLLRKRPRSDEEAFNAQSAAKGTGGRFQIIALKPLVGGETFFLLVFMSGICRAAMRRAGEATGTLRPRGAFSYRMQRITGGLETHSVILRLLCPGLLSERTRKAPPLIC